MKTQPTNQVVLCLKSYLVLHSVKDLSKGLQSVMVFVVGKRTDNLSSNPAQSSLYFT